MTLQKKLASLLCASLITACSMFTGHSHYANEDWPVPDQLDYKVRGYEVAKEGTQLVEVQLTAPDHQTACQWARVCAVHGVIFNGVPANGRIPDQPPINSQSQLTRADSLYFNNFFSKGADYSKFSSLINGGELGVGGYVRLDRHYGQYTLVIEVQTDKLRRHLENTGMIKPLDYGF